MPNVPNLPGVPPLSSYLSGPLPTLIADTVLSFGSNKLQWGIYDQFGVPIIASALAPLYNSLGTVGSVLNSVSSLLIGQQLVNQLSVVDFEYKQEWNISSAPTEAGGFQSYNKVQMPFDVQMRVAAGGNVDNRQSLLTLVDNLANAGLIAGIPGVSSSVSTLIQSPGLLSGAASIAAAAILGAPTSLPLYNVVTPEKIYTSCSVTHYDYKRTAINGLGIIVIDIWLRQVRVTATSSFSNTKSPVAAGQTALGNVNPGASTPIGSVVPQ